MIAAVNAETPITALLIEDDARLAHLTSEYLEGHSVRVTRAADGTRGLEEALRFRYDVVLLDLMLPGRGGLEVCRALRERSDVPIIVLTARGEETDGISRSPGTNFRSCASWPSAPAASSLASRSWSWRAGTRRRRSIGRSTST